MQLQFAFLKSKVAKRIFFLFVIAAIIPVGIIGLLSYNYVTSLLIKQKQEYLTASSKSYGMAIYDRILVAEDQFISLGKNFSNSNDTNTSTVADTPIILDYNMSHFSDIKIYSVSSNSNNKDLNHLLNGNTRIAISKSNNNSIEMLFTRMLNPTENSYLLSAKVNTSYIFGDMDIFAGDEDACIVTKNIGTINCSNSDFYANSASTFENNALNNTGAQIIEMQGNKFVVASWELFLNGSFNTDSWFIYYVQPSNVIFEPIKSFTNILLPTLLLTLLLVSLVSLNQISKILIPLETLTSITKKIAKRDFSKKTEFTSDDEFQTLGDSFNNMSSELSKQFTVMTAMSNLDRTILSSKNIKNTVDAIFQYLKVINNYEYLGAVIMDFRRSEIGYFYNYDENSKQVNINAKLRISAEEQSTLSNQSNSFVKIIRRKHVHRFKWLSSINLSNFVIIPIKQKEILLGFILLGYERVPQIKDEDLMQLENFCDRVAVALYAAKREQKLLLQANYDDLTGLPNRQQLVRRLKNAILVATHHENQIAFLFVDLDRFKVINDSQGHATGDKLLIAAGDRIKACVRSCDTVARYGGDEFAVILTDINNSKSVSTIAEEIIKRLSEVFYIDNYEQIIGASIGISIFPRDGNSWEKLVQKADIAMYKAKQKDHGRHLFFTDTMQEAICDKAEIEADLFHAIEREEIHLVYQPQIDIASGEISGAEALLRWNHSNYGPIQPDRFIEYAEESGLIVSLGGWAMQKAIKQCKKWQIAHQALPKIAINISARQLRHESFMSDVEAIVSDFDIGTTNLEFEITESLFLSDDKHTLGMLHSLNKLGISIAIDDFGKGYSSLSYLKKLPAQTLKIDRLFIKDLTRDNDSIAIVKAIIVMGKALNKVVIAEGVETLDQLNILKDLGCDRAQGFYISKPKVAEEFLDYSKTAIIQLEKHRSNLKIVT